MNNLYPAAAIILSEISIALLVLCSILIFTMLKNRRSGRNALTQVTGKIKQNEPERLNSLKKMLKENYHLDDAKVDETAGNLLKTEMLYYQGLMNAIANRNTTSLDEFCQKIDLIIDAYRNLVPQTGGLPANAGSTEVKQEGDTDALSGELARLKAENEKLTQALDSTKQELEDTVTEFSKTFSGGQEGSENIITAEKTTAIPAADVQQKNNPDTTAAQEIKKTEDSLKSQGEASKTSGQDDNDLLKDIDIDFSDISIDDDDTSKQPEAAQKLGADIGSNFDIDIGEIDIDVPGIDATPDKTATKDKA